ncbi:hypothetical protein EI167_21730, partial [Pseudoalteromonas prydzensis]|nr:hypothetical protein [Pseudoalteromonas prydzensis]
MNSYSLKKKILLSVVLALTIVVVLLSWYSYSTQKALLLKSSVASVSQSGKQQAERIAGWLADRQRVITSVAAKIEENTLYGLQQAQRSGDFQLTYYAKGSPEIIIKFQLHHSHPYFSNRVALPPVRNSLVLPNNLAVAV